MDEFDWNGNVKCFDERRNIVIPGDKNETIEFCVKQFIQLAKHAISQRGLFTVALSGGSTPNAIYQKLSQAPYRDQIDWTKVFLFWGDERSVPPDHSDSNFHNSLQAGLGALGIPEEHIFRMVAEDEIEENSLAYENLIRKLVPNLSFDLIMLGMGEDGHTASLFPKTHGIHAVNRLVIANFVPQKHTWRMTFTYDLIHQAQAIVIYVIGKRKAEMVERVLVGHYEPEELPIQRIGTSHHKAVWVLDKEACEKLLPALGYS